MKSILIITTFIFSSLIAAKDIDLKKIPKSISSIIQTQYQDSYFYAYPMVKHPVIYKKQNDRYKKVRLSTIKLKEKPTEKDQTCWNYFLSGSKKCYEVSPILTSTPENAKDQDYLQLGRIWTQDYGLKVATEQLYKEFGSLDQSNGEMETRFKKTSSNKSFIFEDSFATISEEEGKNVGVFFLLGIGGEKSANADLINLSAKRVKEMGFASEVLDASGTLGSAHNANILRAQIKEKVGLYNKVIFVAASKGVSDFINYFLNYGNELTFAERNKIKLMVSLSGVIRSSLLAGWMVESKAIKARLVRTGLRLTKRKKMLIGLKSLTKSEWEGHDPAKISKLFPKMLWISMPMLPEGDIGYTNKDKLANFSRKSLLKGNSVIGPSDGLVESAASVLPPGTGLKQWVIRAFGPHGLALGKFDDGSFLAPENIITEKEADVEAGPEILDAFFRSLPLEILD